MLTKKRSFFIHGFMDGEKNTNWKNYYQNSLCTPPKFNIVSRKLPSQKSGLPTIQNIRGFRC